MGVVLIVAGLGCFPLGRGVNPVRDLSVFENLADLDLFWKMGFALVGVGIAFLVAGGIAFVLTPRSLRGARQ
jgi:hypothetical protein